MAINGLQDNQSARLKEILLREIDKLDKKTQRAHLAHFAVRHLDLPTDVLIFGDKPDLIIVDESGDIGVEHTQLFRDKGTKKGALQAQEQYQNEALNLARARYEQQGGEMLTLYAHFSMHHPMTKRNWSDVAARFADAIGHGVTKYHQQLAKSGSLDLEQWRYNRIFPNAFPKEIDTVHIRLAEASGRGFWAAVRSSFVPHLTVEQLQEAINGKDDLLAQYNPRCSKFWLLLASDGGVPSSYFDLPTDVAQAAYRSIFDKVFYFESFSATVTELNVGRPSAEDFKPVRKAV